jgi:hypothetical protein
MFNTYLCTLNNPDIPLEDLWNPDKMKYLGGQKEIGEQGTAHYQFVIRFQRSERLAAIKKIHKGIHAEPAQFPDKAREYCLKTETRVAGPWEYGEWKKNGFLQSYNYWLQ